MKLEHRSDAGAHDQLQEQIWLDYPFTQDIPR